MLVGVALVLFKPLDLSSSDSIDSAFKRSLVSFAIARGLNGVISVAQGTEFAVQPAGVGINFSPGEILDPVNDLVERFSWVMLLSSSSLGMQQVLLSISGWIGISIVFILASTLFVFVLWRQDKFAENSQKVISKFFIFILILRFSVPVVALCNEWVYQQFLNDQYTDSSRLLADAKDEIGKINQNPDLRVQNSVDADGFLDKAIQLYNSTVNQLDFEAKLDRYQAAAEKVSENTVRLIVVYVLQTIFFPLFFLWLIFRIFKGM